MVYLKSDLQSTLFITIILKYISPRGKYQYKLILIPYRYNIILR